MECSQANTELGRGRWGKSNQKKRQQALSMLLPRESRQKPLGGGSIEVRSGCSLVRVLELFGLGFVSHKWGGGTMKVPDNKTDDPG